MSTLRPASPKEKSGRLSSPYDINLDNTYRLAFETADIRQFHVALKITGKAQDGISAKVWEQYDGKERVLVQKDAKLKPGGSFALQGKLPKALTVTRQKNGCEYDFSYAQASDGPRWFEFSTINDGYGLAKYKAKKGANKASKTEMYCNKTPLPGNNAGTTIECSFPGW